MNRVGAASSGCHQEKNMEPVNGTIEPKSFLNGVNGKAPEPEKKLGKGEPAAKSFTNGRILTRVWAELMVWGDIKWRVSQIRTGSDSRGPDEYRSLHFEDLWDGIRGYYQAHQWIRRIERRRNRRWFRWW